MNADISLFEEHRVLDGAESGVPNISRWDITKTKFKRWCMQMGMKAVSLINSFMPQSMRAKWDPHDDKSPPYWLGKTNHFITNNERSIKWLFFGFSFMLFLSLVLIPMISIITEMNSTDKYVTDVKVLAASNVESYANAIKHHFEVWKRKAIESRYKEDSEVPEHTHRRSNSDSFDDILGPNKDGKDYDNDDQESEQDDALFLQTMTDEYNQKNICTKTLEYKSWLSPKKMCYDVVKHMLDKRYNPTYRPDKKQSPKHHSDEMTCLCSDHFGLRSEFVYMSYPGEPSKLFINPVLYPESDKNLISYTVSQPKGTQLYATDEKLRDVTNSKPSILQPKKIKVSYHTLPEKSEIEKIYPATADVPNFIKKMSIRDKIGSTGNPLVDGLLWFAQALDWIYSSMFGSNEPLYDKKEISKIMQYRMERKYPSGTKESESAGGFKIIKNLFKSDSRDGEELDYKETEEVEMPQSSCLLYCKRFHQKLSR
jgi:hypothetical protein